MFELDLQNPSCHFYFQNGESCYFGDFRSNFRNRVQFQYLENGNFDGPIHYKNGSYNFKNEVKKPDELSNDCENQGYFNVQSTFEKTLILRYKTLSKCFWFIENPHENGFLSLKIQNFKVSPF